MSCLEKIATRKKKKKKKKEEKKEISKSWHTAALDQEGDMHAYKHRTVSTIK